MSMPTHQKPNANHHRFAGLPALAAAALALAALAACGPTAQVTGTFDKTFPVNGPVRLELTTGSGDAHITTGAADSVVIHGQIHAGGWAIEGAQRDVRQAQANPPVSQEGNLIRVGGAGRRESGVNIDYTIEVPPSTELHSSSGSGDVSVNGIQGPANFTSGSGGVSASQIAGDAQATTESGDIHLANIQGQATVTAGSGDVEARYIAGETRIRTGSGSVQVTQPAALLTVQTGSGDIRISGASGDLHLNSSSGDTTVEGNPTASHFWDIHSASGSIVLNVPASGNFRLYAHSSSGGIDAQIPVTMDGATTSKHELRARIGDGSARIEASTTSGSISLR
ncbi:MAG: DUF4097 family beta strand repeat-containing protein [Candidatus Acidiferrales bacterium]